jgi:hypothetical protein
MFILFSEVINKTFIFSQEIKNKPRVLGNNFHCTCGKAAIKQKIDNKNLNANYKKMQFFIC